MLNSRILVYFIVHIFYPNLCVSVWSFETIVYGISVTQKSNRKCKA